ncbi:MAG TPA: hypothetical protein VKZ49_12350 [Polyangiaceae bacterium]|nr:hypothetical protein [Polyangiaceae bacterium]
MTAPTPPPDPHAGPPPLRRLLLAAAVALLCLAPTPGDIGGCGQEVQELDPELFFEHKRNIDCDRCQECSLATAPCTSACASPSTGAFPEDCVPLVHDGEVCLRALLDASCSEYLEYMREVNPKAPSECNFCPPDRAP